MFVVIDRIFCGSEASPFGGNTQQGRMRSALTATDTERGITAHLLRTPRPTQQCSSVGTCDKWRKNAIDPKRLPKWKKKDNPFLNIKAKLPEGWARTPSVHLPPRRTRSSSSELVPISSPDRKNAHTLKKVNRAELNEIYNTVVEERENTGMTCSPLRTKYRLFYEVLSTLDDMVEAVSLQPDIQHVKERLGGLPIRGRPQPDSVSPQQLGPELKIRLACFSPVLTEKLNSKKRVAVTHKYPPYRQVPIYDVDDDEDDCSVLCYLRVKANKARRKSADF